MKRASLIIGSIFLLAELLFGFPFVYGFPPHLIVKEELSPDGKLMALYSWKPVGILGWISKDNPMVYLRVVDRETGRVLAESSAWGDTPNDAVHRLGDIIVDIVPWHEK